MWDWDMIQFNIFNKFYNAFNQDIFNTPQKAGITKKTIFQLLISTGIRNTFCTFTEVLVNAWKIAIMK